MEKQQGTKLEVKQTFPLTIKRLGINGEGVGYFKKQVVFVPGSWPSARARSATRGRRSSATSP
jgi:23S rRNA (uracil1939-C5)-methyltransferase